MSTVTDIEPGATVHVQNPRGEWVKRTATSGVERGQDFPVVWVQAEGREPVPWPADAIRFP